MDALSSGPVWAFFFAHFSVRGPGVLVLVTKVFWHNIILLTSSRKKKERKSTLRRNFHLIWYNVMQDCRLMASRYIAQFLCRWRTIIYKNGHNKSRNGLTLNWSHNFYKPKRPYFEALKIGQANHFSSRHPQAKKKIRLWAYNSHVLVKSFTQ